ncbi:hypothetical protein E4T56_gene11562 [Termitomyces sp. T112]|nr:hypothetical protein E4T56_gene11562 [Termitomyces sp. T112]
MSIALSHRWIILSRAFSRAAPRQTAPTLALHLTSRSTSESVDFVGNTTQLNSPSDSLIFESESEDYASVARHSVPMMISTMSRIEAELPLRLPEPVVSDAAVFEDISSEDYASLRISLRKPPSTTIQALEGLIRAERHREAWAFCQEMLSSGIEIPRSNVYGIAAMAVLALNDLPEKEQLSRFSLWLSLIPSAREDQGHDHKNIVLMRRRIFHGLQPTIALAIKFSLIMASKGYAELICPEAMTFITRFSLPSVSLRFIKDFLNYDLAYVIDLYPKPEEGLREVDDEVRLRRLQELAHLVQKPAIETYTRSGEFAAAVSLLPNSKDPFRLSSRTYELLLSRLHHTRVGSFSDYIDLVEKLRQDPTYYEIPRTPSYVEVDTNWHTKTSHLKALEKELDSESPFYMGDSLSHQLRYILDRIRLSELSAPELVIFFSDYLDSERTTAIMRLRKLALGRNWPTGSIFLYAEMSYYLNQAFYPLVLQTYMNHFYCSGVPEQELAAAIHHFEANEEVDRSHPAYSVKQSRSIRRWIPTESHTDLVWHALARAAPARRDVDNLYHRFIRYQLRIREKNPPEDETRSSFPPSIEHPIGTSVFTVFLSRLLRPDEPNRVSEFFHDMEKVGVNPTIHHFTLLVTFYVHIGDLKRVFSIVHILEQAHPVESPIPMQLSLETVHGQRPEPGIPIPDVVFYTSLLGALVEHKYLQEAQEIRRLFNHRFIHIKYLHRPLDIGFIRLKQLQHEVDQQRITFR